MNILARSRSGTTMPRPLTKTLPVAGRCLLRRCHECNSPVGNKDVFCPRCGAKLRREKLEPCL